jgi:hypothetical protein
MGLKLSNTKAFNEYLKQTAEDYFPLYIINEMAQMGEVFIKDARTKERPKGYFANVQPLSPTSSSFANWTTRLRNSIGYVVSRDGVVKKSDFDSYGISGEASAEGKALGLQYATEIASQTQGYALICVAGADYGLYVEAKGYDVITGSVLTLKQELIKRW